MITNPYLESVHKEVNSEVSNIVGIAENNNDRLDDTEYDNVEEFEEGLNETADDIREVLKNTEEDVHGDRYINIELLFQMGCLFGEFKGRHLESDGIHTSPKWILYETAYISLYNEAEKLLWTIKNE